MLSDVDNQYMCRIGPGTPMGEYVRRFWLPFLLPEELPEPDCPPVRTTLLGEELVAYKDSNGEIGLLDNNCPHRRASLFFGRNEESGLRCVYHGWKYDVNGDCVDMPSEPAESNFKDKVKIKAYPAREYGGLIWAYMGPVETMPALPEIDWATLPDSHRVISKRVQESNWVQSVEGGIDSSHISFLHSGVTPFMRDNPDERPARRGGGQPLTFTTTDTSPRFVVDETDYGLLISARRDADQDRYYFRITQMLMPFYTMIPGAIEPGRQIGGHAWVPIDDYSCWNFSISWNPYRPFTDEEVKEHWSGYGLHALTDHKYQPLSNKSNDYNIDREEQRYRTFTGIKGIGEQDMGTQESMGALTWRAGEHLGSSDSAIITYRRRLLKEARDLQEGIESFAATHPESYKVRSASVLIKRGEDYREVARDRLAARI